MELWKTAEDKAGPEGLKIGKYISLEMRYVGYPYVYAYLDEKIASEAYDLSFGSRSEIDEFFNKHMIPVISAMGGMTKYSYSFDSIDISSILNNFNYIGQKKNYEGKWETIDCSDIGKEIKKYSQYIDALVEICSNQKFGEVVDTLIETWMEGMRKICNSEA